MDCLFVSLAATPCAVGQVKILSVVNSASFQPGLPSGGALATVFCSGLSLAPGTYLAPATGPLPLSPAGIQVVVNNAVAPILAIVVPQPADAAPAQINFQVPPERNSTSLSASDGGSFAIVGVGGTLPNGGAELTPIPTAGQGGFFANANGDAIAFHSSDSTPVTVQSPAHAGETLIVYADDFFLVWPPPPIAVPVGSQPLYQLQTALADAALAYCC
ncbi:MAG: hypothetical protein ACLQU1_22590 [Bryobacteraceae bacterium]